MDVGVAPLVDGELIGRFCDGAAPTREEAFSALIQRHGPMVVGACRRLLGDGSDADDAAQAVFVILARKATVLRQHPSLGGWLHRTATHVARRHRDGMRIRHRHEQEAGAMLSARLVAASPHAPSADRPGELREILDVALDHLSERYRVPLILHYLEGRSQDEVASVLGVPTGTVASLLSRGRDRLRSVLGRRGVAIGASALALVLVESGRLGAEALAPAMAAGLGAGAGGAGCSGTVSMLVHHGLRSLAWAQAKLGVALAGAALVVCASGLTVVMHARRPGPGPAPSHVAAAPLSAVRTPAAPQPASPILRQTSASALDQGAVATLQAWIRDLRQDHPEAIFDGFPADRRLALQEAWGHQVADLHPWMRQMIDRQFTLALGNDGGVGLRAELLAVATALDGRVDHPGHGHGWPHAGVRITREPEAKDQPGLFLAASLGHWLAQAGIEDPIRLDRARALITAALADLGVDSWEALGTEDLHELLRRCGPAMAKLKTLGGIYGLDADAMLDSAVVSLADVQIPGPAGRDRRRLWLDLTAFATHVRLTLVLEHAADGWQILDSGLGRLRGHRHHRGIGRPPGAPLGPWPPWEQRPSPGRPGTASPSQPISTPSADF